MTAEARLRHALERCREWNIRHGNWSQEMEELVDAALADPAPADCPEQRKSEHEPA